MNYVCFNQIILNLPFNFRDMFFFGAFSTLIPYVIIAVIYSVFMITLSVEKHSKSHTNEAEAKNLYIESSDQQISEDTIHFSDVYIVLSDVPSIEGAEFIHPPFIGSFSPPKDRAYIADEAFDDYSLYPNPPPLFS
jgi:hypothetical protein